MTAWSYSNFLRSTPLCFAISISFGISECRVVLLGPIFPWGEKGDIKVNIMSTLR